MFDANGRGKNMNTTADDQTVTLTVTFTSGGETKTESKVLTLVKRTLADLAIVGDSAIANGLTSAYECKATWSDGTTSLITPKWTLSSTLHASLDTTGRVTNKNTTSDNQTVTLIADFQSGDIAKTATKSITMVKRTLKSITVNGATMIASGEDATYSCIATWSDDTTSEVMAEWSLDSTEFAASPVTPSWSLSEDRYAVLYNGRVTNKNTMETEQTVALEATYTSGGVTCVAVKNITLAKRGITSIAIAGDASIASGGHETYVCKATWSDDTTSEVMAEWSLDSTEFAALEAGGRVVNRNTTDTDATVSLTATFTYGDVTKTAFRSIRLVKRTLLSIAVAGDDTIGMRILCPLQCRGCHQRRWH